MHFLQTCQKMAVVEKLERPILDGGPKFSVTASDVPKERQLEAIMERLRSKATHFKSWTENAKALRMALMDKRHVLDSAEKNQLQKCLDTLQRSIKVTSLQSMVERLESISRQLGLKFTAGPSGTDCFISSDMFYVEVLLEATGTVKDAKIAHHGDPVSCPELADVLSKGDFVEFTKHLEGLSAIYQLNADKKQKSKAYLALQALETDLTMLSQLQSAINDPCNLVHKSPVGILQTRRGGHPMKLTYSISPYDLLDMESKSLLPLTVDAVVEKQLGYSVMVCIESSVAHKLQTQSLMSISRTNDGKSLPSFAALSNLNSTTLPASFVLKLDSPMPIAIAFVRKIQAITQIECADLSTTQPLLALITERASKGELESHNRGLFVTLPDQHHCYFLSGGSDLQGVMVSSIPFTHPTHVPQILIFLRQQALFNVLISSFIRPKSKQDPESALMFEVSALSWLHITVAFEHPIEESMATAEFDLSDITNVKCKLHTMPYDTPICTDEYASKVIQRCLSIPITMRAVIRKAQGQQQQMNHSNGDMLINLVSSSASNLLGNSSPFSEVGGGSKFVTDFDVKLNGCGSDSMSDSPTGPKLDVLTAASIMSSSTTSYSGAGGGGGAVPSEAGHNALVGSLETQGFLDGKPFPSASSSSHGDLFSIPPERAGSLNTSGLLGNVLSQAALQPLQQQASTPPPSTSQQLNLPASSSTQIVLSQGKPNAMLMNLLNDVPQGQPLNVGGAPTQGSTKPRKQRKRKSTTDVGSPRGSTGRSPKRKPSEDDCSSKDLPTPDVESNDSIGLGFEVGGIAGVTAAASSSVFLLPCPTSVDTHPSSVLAASKSTTLEAFVNHEFGTTISLSRASCDVVSVTARERPRSSTGIEGSFQGSAHFPGALPSGSALPSGGDTAEGVPNSGSADSAREFQFKSEKLDFDANTLESHIASVTGELADDGDDFSRESGSSSVVGAHGHATLVSTTAMRTTGGNNLTTEKLKDGSRKAKKVKIDILGHKSEEEVALGKEIEKIPIVLDFTSGGESKSDLLRAADHVDRRPSVEIIPLGTAATTSSSMPPTSAAALTMFNTGLKIAKPLVESSKKEGKLKQRELRRVSGSELLDRKSKVEGKKERKRKRLEMVGGVLVPEGTVKPPKIINVITPIPSSHGSGVAVMDKTVSVVAHKPAMELAMSKALTMNAKSALTSPTNPSISVSVTKTVMTPTSTTKKALLPSPNVSPSLSISPNKSVSILKTSQCSTNVGSGSGNSSASGPSKPKLPPSKASGAVLGNVGKGSGGGGSGSSATTEGPSGAKNTDSPNAKVTISPLKVQNKNRQGVMVKNGSQSPSSGGTLPLVKVPTRPATVKLKQLNLSSMSSSPSSMSSSSSSSSTPTTPHTTTSPTVSKSSVMTLSGSVSPGASVISTCSSASGSTSSSGSSTPSCMTSTSVTLSTPSPLSSKSQSLMLTASQINLMSVPDLLAVQKAQKLAARSRKGSLSAVIDKLMASSMQHTGSAGENVQPEGKKVDGGTSKLDGMGERKEPNKGEKKEMPAVSFQKGGDSRQLKSVSSEGKSSSEGKKPEFTVKQSPQGIKLTVTKTHHTEGSTKLSSSLKGSSTKSCSTKFLSSSPNSNKISGSATGLKPGVNSGPASKKGVVSFGPSKPSSGQSKSSVASGLPSKAVVTTSSSHPVPQSPTTVLKTLSTMTAATTTTTNSVTKPVLKHSGGDGSKASISKGQEKMVKSGGSTEAVMKPTTPKILTMPIVTPVSATPSSSMPPPPPPVVEHPPQTMSKKDDSPLRHSPIKQFANTKYSRDSPVEESDTERAFQRLLQSQQGGGGGGGGGSISTGSGGTVFTKSSIENSDSSTPITKPEGSRTPKSDLADKSPKHTGINSDGRSTPKSSVQLVEKVSGPTANVIGAASMVVSKVNQIDMSKRPSTPKSEMQLAPKSESFVMPVVTQAPVDMLPVLPPKSEAHKVAPKAKLPSSPIGRESNSPDGSLVIDCPSTPRQKSPEAKLTRPPQPSPLPDLSSIQTKSPMEMRTPASPSIQQMTKSPAQPSPAIRSPAVVNTPQSEHSNPSSVAHSSPYDIDDELMDEALVGLGK